jgi:hypothetical protein
VKRPTYFVALRNSSLDVLKEYACARRFLARLVSGTF